MLIETVPELFCKLYKSSMSVPFAGLLKKFCYSPERLSSKEMVEVLDYATEHKSIFLFYCNLLLEQRSYCKNFIDPATGNQRAGFLDLSNEFASYLLDKSYLLDTRSREGRNLNVFPSSVVVGAADSFDEITLWIDELEQETVSALAPKQLLQIRDRLEHDYVVRVLESSNQTLFRGLYHVGNWGRELSQSSNYAKLQNLSKCNTEISSVHSPSQIWDILVSAEESSIHVSDDELDDYIAYGAAYGQRTRQNNPFLVFEIINFVNVENYSDK